MGEQRRGHAGAGNRPSNLSSNGGSGPGRTSLRLGVGEGDAAASRCFNTIDADCPARGTRMRIKQTVLWIAIFAAGIASGGYLFSGVTPRSFLAFNDCQDRCLRPNELTGLIASAGIRRMPFLVPDVALESDSCVAIRYPRAGERVHYVLFPKHDIRDISTLTAADLPYIAGCFALVRQLVTRGKLEDYRVLTNGPGYQDIAYLHFHLLAAASIPR